MGNGSALILLKTISHHAERRDAIAAARDVRIVDGERVMVERYTSGYAVRVYWTRDPARLSSESGAASDPCTS